MSIQSKLPQVGTTIFTTMSALAQEHQAVNLSQGFPDFKVAEALIKEIDQAMQSGMNQYAPMAGLISLREQISIKTEQLYQYAPHPETEITITAGATEALFDAITTIAHPKDEIIVVEPAYDSYIPAILLSKATPISISLKKDFSVDWEAIKKAINPQTKAIIFNTPHNPTGRIWRKEDMQQLEKVVAENPHLWLISDEVYEHIIFDNETHESVLKYPTLREKSFVISSFGKTYHATGWKIGYCIAPVALTQEFRKVHQFVTFSAHTPTQVALAAYLKNPNHYLELPTFYQERRDYCRTLLSQTPFELLPCEGTYFQTISYAHLSQENDVEYAKRLTREIGVATIPISVFYAHKTDHKVLRVCFAKQNQTLETATERLMKKSHLLAVQ
ncbi:MAG: aminotransferase class I/II-fold pyridoxal phosphate-dependent enzyme [Cytophagales bacterium]|nr:MAG: aminotransferase class I/II-fold pyridoxal phosphate-dependent enzyme [Cytophagales bacterium]